MGKSKKFVPYREGSYMIITEGKYGKGFVDVDDYDLVKDYRWQANKVGNVVYCRAFADIESNRTYITVHRLLTGQPACLVDHIDGNGLNNSRSNLRLTSYSGNFHNRKDASGIFYNKKFNHFRTQMTVNGKNYYLGAFQTEMQASNVYRRVNQIVCDLISTDVTKELLNKNL